MEREQIAYRLNSGRQLAIEKGVKMGRKTGYRLSEKELLAKYPKVVRKLNEGLSVREPLTDDLGGEFFVIIENNNYICTHTKVLLYD